MSLVGPGFGAADEASAGANFAGVVYRDVRNRAKPGRIGYYAHCARPPSRFLKACFKPYNLRKACPRTAPPCLDAAFHQ